MADNFKPLRVNIVGAGIGGLSAAIALRQQGHLVELFEQSRLAQETGAAINLAPNANGLAKRLGLNCLDHGGIECTTLAEWNPYDDKLKWAIPVARDSWEHPWHLIHRAHLHTALKDLALSEEKEGTPAKLHLASRVEKIDAHSASMTLEDGTTIAGDILIGADGVHSRTRTAVPGCTQKPFDSGHSAFRFLIPTDLLAADPLTAPFVERVGCLSMWFGPDRRLIMYPCVNSTMMNFVAIHPSGESAPDEASSGGGWQGHGSKELLKKTFETFTPAVRRIFDFVDEPKLKLWNLLDMDPIPRMNEASLALLGDAAHPFLPHQGQGGAQAMEDAMSLAALLPLGTLPEQIPKRLELYNKCRYERAHIIQDFTRLVGKDKAQLEAEGKTVDMLSFTGYNFGHDEWYSSSKALRMQLQEENPSQRHFMPRVFGPAPGPRQPLGRSPSDPVIQAIRASSPESYASYTIRFKSSRTYLETILPPGFAFTKAATVVSATLIITQMRNMTWLGGGGYTWCGLKIHGVEYKKQDGSKVHGTFFPLLFENLTDPILTGRSELGMPKLFADIDVQADEVTGNCNISLSWRGAQFGKFSIEGLAKNDTTVNGHESKDNSPKQEDPVDEGLLVDRYVPSVGEPGKADANYAVLCPQSTVPPDEMYTAKTASIEFIAGDWTTLPTLHHVAKTLAEIPIYSIEEAGLAKGSPVDDLVSTRRIE